MDLFDYMREQNKEKESPLASRLRPTNTGRSGGTAAHHRQRISLLYRAIKADKLQFQLFSMDLRVPERRHWQR